MAKCGWARAIFNGHGSRAGRNIVIDIGYGQGYRIGADVPATERLLTEDCRLNPASVRGAVVHGFRRGGTCAAAIQLDGYILTECRRRNVIFNRYGSRAG